MQYVEWDVEPCCTFETPTLLDDEVLQRGVMVPGHENICKPERTACNLSAIEL